MSQVEMRVGQNKIRYMGSEADVLDRFKEIKRHLREQEDFEITNDYVLDVLCDVYWLHAEDA